MVQEILWKDLKSHFGLTPPIFGKFVSEHDAISGTNKAIKTKPVLILHFIWIVKERKRPKEFNLLFNPSLMIYIVLCFHGMCLLLVE